MSVQLLESGFNGVIRLVGEQSGIEFPDGLVQTIAYQGGGGGGNVFDTIIVNDQAQFDPAIADVTPAITMTNGAANENFFSMTSVSDSTAATSALNSILLATKQDANTYGALFSGAYEQNTGLGTFLISTGQIAPVNDPVAVLGGNANLITANVPFQCNSTLQATQGITSPGPITIQNIEVGTSVVTISSQGAAVDDGQYNQLQLTEYNGTDTNGVILGGGTTPGGSPGGVISVIGGGATDPVMFFTQTLNSSGAPFQTSSTFNALEAATFQSTAQFNGAVTNASTLTANLGLTTFASAANLKFSYTTAANVAEAVLNNLANGATSANITLAFTDTFTTVCYGVNLNLFVTNGVDYYPAAINYRAQSVNSYSFSITNISGAAFPANPSITYTLLAFGN